MTSKKKPETKSREVAPPAPAPAHCDNPFCAIHGSRRVMTATFSTRQYPKCEAYACARPEGGTMQANQSDKRDKFCGGCGEKLHVVIRLLGFNESLPRHCRECGRERGRFYLTCPNARWWNAPWHFQPEHLGVARLIHEGDRPEPKA
jgi:hypothetical protein